MEKNPFVITFGKKPIEYIFRPHQTGVILNIFLTDPITNQVYIIRGPRGSGKTVLLSNIANKLEEENQWVVISCAPSF
jgi:Cdc6-like AAA superfamily ATPase